jgi:hypothetical protein
VAFGITSKVTGGYLQAGISFLKRVTGKIFRIIKWFQRSKQKLYFLFSPAKRQQNIVKANSGDPKCTDLIFRTLKKYSFRNIIPLIFEDKNQFKGTQA